MDFYSLNEHDKEEENEHNEEENRKRINIEALEFDWIFTEDNAENLISILG